MRLADQRCDVVELGHAPHLDNQYTVFGKVLRGDEVLSQLEQRHVLGFVRRMAEHGDEGALVNRTYSAPRRWMRGKGRVTVQHGCCYNYATDRQGNPPGILPSEAVCGMPPLFEDIVDRMVARGIFAADTRPNSAIVNFYDVGDCIPPHIDHHDFARPFVTLSLLSEHPLQSGVNKGDTRSLQTPETIFPFTKVIRDFYRPNKSYTILRKQLRAGTHSVARVMTRDPSIGILLRILDPAKPAQKDKNAQKGSFAFAVPLSPSHSK